MNLMLVRAVCVLAALQAATMAQVGWQQVAASGPAARGRHAMVYDSQRGRTVLFGGATDFLGSGFLGDTWEWDGTSWTQLFVTGPSARGSHSMVYDSQRGRTVLFGGYNNNDLGDTWEWDGAVWSLTATTGPSPRHGHAMAYDSQRGRTVLFGGLSGNGTWEWDGTSWTQVATAGPTGDRFGHAMVYDWQRRRTVLFGGNGAAPGLIFGDTWEWDGTTWTQVATTGPSPRSSHAMVYDDSRTVLFGGGTFTSSLSDTWLWSGSTWTSVAVAAPPGRGLLAMSYDSARATTVLFGGWGVSGTGAAIALGDTWAWGQLAPVPSYAPLGSGCIGPNGLTPSLAGAPGEVPRPGTTSHIRVSNLPPVVTIPVFVVGFSNAWDPDGYELPLDLGIIGWTGCTQFVADEILYWQITTSGQADQPITVPANTPLGFTFYVQALVLYAPVGVAASNAVTGIVGY